MNIKDKIGTFLGGIALGAVVIVGIAYLGSGYNQNKMSADKTTTQNNPIQAASDNKYSFKTGLESENFPQKLVESGAIDIEKYIQLVGEIPSQEGEIIITQENNQPFLNLFWGLGLAQENEYLTELKSLEQEGQLEGLASTGGWVVTNGSASDHFSKHNILNLTDEQQKKVADIASTIYRPCCGNSARFADCNHGMAMLGMLSLGVSQGFSDDRLYRLALGFNSVWFPDQYNQMASYFKLIEKKDVLEVDPRMALSAKFSSGQGFSQNVAKPLAALNNPSGPSESGGGSCSL